MKNSLRPFLCALVFLVGSTSLAHGAQPQVRYQYDPNNRLTTVTYLKGDYLYTQRYFYDANGNLLNKVTGSELYNLLSNSSFETYMGTSGLADQWMLYSDADASYAKAELVQSPVYEGKMAQQISGVHLVTRQAVALQQTFPVVSGRTFTVSGQVNITSLTNCQVQLYVDFYDASNQFLPPLIVEYSNTSSGQFVLLQGTGTVPPQAVSAKVHVILRAIGTEGSGSLIVDNMNFHYGI